MSAASLEHNRYVNLRRVTQFSAVLVCFVGVLALLGWQFNIAVLKSVGSGLATMKPLTALMFIGASISLLLSQPPFTQRSAIADRIGRVVAMIVLLLGLLILTEYAFNWNSGVDLLLFRGAILQEVNQFPGRPSIVTALNIVLIGLSLWLQPSNGRVQHVLMQLALLVVLTISLIAVFGYVYSIEELYAIVPYATFALHTALACIVLSIGILATHLNGD